ncbi:hypothetical protein JX266_010117 [Neoarthrinium moseri]|nr:hypothetical protein JX266_010117 [Neoarthrinium moseri]
MIAYQLVWHVNIVSSHHTAVSPISAANDVPTWSWMSIPDAVEFKFLESSTTGSFTSRIWQRATSPLATVTFQPPNHQRTQREIFWHMADYYRRVPNSHQNLEAVINTATLKANFVVCQDSFTEDARGLLLRHNGQKGEFARYGCFQYFGKDKKYTKSPALVQTVAVDELSFSRFIVAWDT